MKRYFHFLIVWYRNLIVRTDGHLFSALFNLKSRIIGSPARVKWTTHHFEVSDTEHPQHTILYRSPLALNMAFEFGLEARAKDLGNSYFLNLIPFKDGDCFIDCGANVGDLLLWFKMRNIQIDYIGFEPSPVEYYLCAKNVKPHTVFPIALWITNTSIDFYLSSRHADSSLIQPKDFDERVKVKTMRLEEFVDRPIKCLKLEAEGAEPEIIQGLLPKLHMVEYIAADLGFERGINEDSTLAPVTNILLSNDFELLCIGKERLTALFHNKSFRKHP